MIFQSENYHKNIYKREPRYYRSGGSIPLGKKKGSDANPGNPPEGGGRPVLFLAGLITLFIGLFVSLGSVFHNTLKFFVNETSHEIYGPYDWAAAIGGAVVLLVGIVLLMFSKSSKAAA